MSLSTRISTATRGASNPSSAPASIARKIHGVIDRRQAQNAANSAIPNHRSTSAPTSKFRPAPCAPAATSVPALINTSAGHSSRVSFRVLPIGRSIAAMVRLPSALSRRRLHPLPAQLFTLGGQDVSNKRLPATGWPASGERKAALANASAAKAPFGPPDV